MAKFDIAKMGGKLRVKRYVRLRGFETLYVGERVKDSVHGYYVSPMPFETVEGTSYHRTMNEAIAEAKQRLLVQEVENRLDSVAF